MTRRKGDINRSFFDDMLGQIEEAHTPAQSMDLPLAQVKPKSGQFRRTFDQGSIEALAASINEVGLLEPIVVREQDGDYEIVAGERRYRALHHLGWEHAPVRIVAFSDTQAELAGAIENLNREDLAPLEEVDAVLMILCNALGVSHHEAVALVTRVRSIELGDKAPGDDRVVSIITLLKQLGYTSVNSFYANRLSLLRYPEDLLNAMRQQGLEYTKARVLARVKDDELRHRLLQDVLQKNLSVDELERRVKEQQDNRRPAPKLYEDFDRVKRRVTKRWVQQLDTAKQRRLRKLLREMEALFDDQ